MPPSKIESEVRAVFPSVASAWCLALFFFAALTLDVHLLDWTSFPSSSTLMAGAEVLSDLPFPRLSFAGRRRALNEPLSYRLTP